MTYLMVFENIRYLIKMIFEIITGITAFLIILGLTFLAFTQIMFSFTFGEAGWLAMFRGSYVLSLGELGDFGEYSIYQSAFFFVFSFFVPLVLMNMLIAIMSDTYARVQENSIAANNRALGGMLLE